jgi:hypothetical protein
MSISPGRSVRSGRSITSSASAAMLPSDSTDLMRLPSTQTQAPSRTSPASMSRTPRGRSTVNVGSGMEILFLPVVEAERLLSIGKGALAS